MRRSVALPSNLPQATNSSTPTPQTGPVVASPSLPASSSSQPQNAPASSAPPETVSAQTNSSGPGADSNSPVSASASATADLSTDLPWKPKPKPKPVAVPQAPTVPLLPGQWITKTPYEHQRNANIARKYEILKSLGLDGGAKAKLFGPVERKKRAKVAKSASEPARRSSRIQNG